MIFPQIAGGVDDATWLFCIERRDVSRWIRDAIEDREPISEANRAQDAEPTFAPPRQARPAPVKRGVERCDRPNGLANDRALSHLRAMTYLVAAGARATAASAVSERNVNVS